MIHPAQALGYLTVVLIRLTRLSNDRHRLEIVRDDVSREATELETRSTLSHDLAHYAVEVEAGLKESFYGRLAKGLSYDELTTTPTETSEAMETERVVVLIQNLYRRGAVRAVDPQEEAKRIASTFTATESPPPRWLTGDVLSRALERLRRLQGQWRATPFQRTMELEFPPDG